MANTQLLRCSKEDTQTALDSFKHTTVLQDLTSIEDQVIVITGEVTCLDHQNVYSSPGRRE